MQPAKRRALMPGWKCGVGVLATLLGCAAVGPLQAEDLQPAKGYQTPPEIVQDILNRDASYVTLDASSPDREHFVIPVEEYFSSLERLGRKTYRLGMLEIVPGADREWRLSSYGNRGLRIFSLASRKTWDVDLPEGVLVSDTMWSPDGSRLAFLVHQKNGTQVWTADVATGRAKPLSGARVMVTLAGRPQRGRTADTPSRLLQWTPDGSILTLLVPATRGPEPRPSAVPNGPMIRHTRKEKTATRTYPFLLRTPHDQALFRHYTTAQLALIPANGKPRPVGEPAMFLDVSLSPDGQLVLAEKIVEPFSYIVSYGDFPRELQVMDLEGNVLSTVRKLPLREAVVVRKGQRRPADDLPREVVWRPDGAGLSLLWKEKKAQEEEEEDEDSDSERKDRLMLLAAPFDVAAAQTLATSQKTFTEVSYSEDGRKAFATLTGKGDGSKNRHDIVVLDLASESPEPRVLVGGIDPKDVYALPGKIVTRATGNGVRRTLVSTDGLSVYLSGDGYREDLRPRPFVDRLALADGSRERLFEGAEDGYEKPLVFLDDDLSELVFSRESKSDFPDSFVRGSDGSQTQLTHNQDPFPELAGTKRVDFEFTRRDGLNIHARITLPPDYQEGTRLPAVFWTYPREFTSFKEYHRAAAQRRNLNRFPQLNFRNASDIWLTQGYAVVEPDIPIIGKGNSFNDNYVAHLVDSMHAAIRKLDRMGYVDVDRLGHGGHSYGAFATANILARAPFFKAGIAGDGAFNRTLTPMTFQSEKRFLWEATDTILEMSPFFHADHLDTPLLMYHGAADNNTGTFLIQSERLMQALTGLGKTAVLYVYPFESHGPRAKETYMDLWARWLEWFDRYVKSPADPAMGGE